MARGAAPHGSDPRRGVGILITGPDSSSFPKAQRRYKHTACACVRSERQDGGRLFEEKPSRLYSHLDGSAHGPSTPTALREVVRGDKSLKAEEKMRSKGNLGRICEDGEKISSALKYRFLCFCA